MKGVIVELWNNGELPLKDGLYFSDGRSLELRIDCYPLSLKKGGWFDFRAFYQQNIGQISTVGITNEIRLSNGCYCCVGEGSWGSDGLIAYLDEDRGLTWVIFSQYSNPFISIIEESGLMVCARSSAEYELVVDVNCPEDVTIQQ